MDFVINGELLDLYLTYIVINLSFIFWFLKSEKRHSLLFIIIPMLIWYYWKIKYEGIIDYYATGEVSDFSLGKSPTGSFIFAVFLRSGEVKTKTESFLIYFSPFFRTSE